MPPGLTWAYDGADGGDLVTAAATGGVPHPTGYPTWLLLASAFLQLPFGSLAYRTNILSSLCTVTAALMVYVIMQSLDQAILSASIASLAFGTFPLVWSQAIITEVNALNALLVATLVFFFVAGRRSRGMDLAGGMTAGLALGNHLASILILPPIFLHGPHPQEQGSNAGSQGPVSPSSYVALLARRLVGLCLGLSVYLIVPLRARTQAPVNWGYAVNWDQLLWLVSGRMYWGRLNDLNGRYLLAGVQAWSRLLFQQLGFVGFALIFVVLAFLFRRSRTYLVPGWLTIVYSGLAILYYSPDSYVYLMPALIGLSIWMGLAGSWVSSLASERFPSIKPFLVLGLPVFFVLRAILAIPSMDLSADRNAEHYAQGTLSTAPAHAIIITEGDEATFSLWYLHYAYRQRPDIAVISGDLLVQAWYHQVLHYTYPDLNVQDNAKEQDLIQDNPARPFCRAGPDLQAPAECSP